MIKNFLLMVVVCFSLLAFGADSEKVPVTLISSVLSGEYGGMTFSMPYQQQEGKIKFITIGMGNWRVDTKKYGDVVDAINDIITIPSIIKSQLLFDVQFDSEYPEDDYLFQYDDIATEAVIATIMSQNNAVINQALISKYSKITSMSSSKQEEEISNLKSASEQYRTSISSLEKNWENVLNSTDNKIQGISRRMEGLVNEMKSADEERRADIQSLLSGYSKLSGLYMTLESKIKENFKPIYVGGSIDALPSSIVSFSNAMETVSSYLGYKGNEKDGYLKLPDIPEGFFFSEQGDGDDDGNGEVGDGKFKSLIDYLYAAGFMPFLPPQLEGEQKIGGTQMASFNRYFSFEFDTGSQVDGDSGPNVKLHAHGVPMPEEWTAKMPWTYNPENNLWENAYVQIGYETIEYSGLSAIEGDNYIRVDVSTKAVTISSSSSSGTANVYFFKIGTIAGGKQVSGAYYTPIIFLYQ